MLARAKSVSMNFGTIVSAILSTCCLIPITLAALGVSVGFLGAYTEVVEKYEPYAFILAFVFLGIGFYNAYGRTGTGRLGKIVLWVSLGLVLIAAGYEAYERWFVSEEEEEARMIREIFTIIRMAPLALIASLRRDLS